MAKQKALLIELSSHSLVIQPWFDAILDSDKEIVVPRGVLNQISKSLIEQGISQELLVFESFHFTRLLIKNLLFKNRKSLKVVKDSENQPAKIIVTSASEMRLPFQCYLNMILISLVGIEILCIRNAGRWRIKNRNILKLVRYSYNPAKNIKVILLEILAYYIERLILKRSRKLVFESHHQMELFNHDHLKLGSKTQIVFCGRQHRSRQSMKKFVEKNYIGIGLLGTINKEKRNYFEVARAVEMLCSEGISVRVFFLGAYLGNGSQEVLDLFGDFIEFAPSFEQSFVSEKLIEEMIQEVDVFISPMFGSHYEQGGSSGAVADSVFWQRPLLLPAKFKSNYLQEELYFYDSIEELKSLLRNRNKLRYNAVNHVEKETLTNFLNRF